MKFTFAFLLMIAVLLPSSTASAQMTREWFCSGWYRVCLRTCPQGDCTSGCRQRRAACLKTGCYHFNVPRPRCINNAEDVALTKRPPR